MNQAHICVVMAVHNRIENVRRSVHAWSLQTRKDFTLVIADDASKEPIEEIAIEYRNKFHVRYVRTSGRRAQKVAGTLNMGTRTIPGVTTHIWYTDGDIIFRKDAIDHAYKHIHEYPQRVIIGRYDWMPPMLITQKDLEHHFDTFVACELPALRVSALDGQKERRKDHRLKVHGGTWFEHTLLDECRAILGANTIVPVKAWEDVGGWDEHIPGANANDCDFGWCLTDAGYKALTCGDTIGYHQWHRRSTAFLNKYKLSMPYIFRKHGKPVPKAYREYDKRA